MTLRTRIAAVASLSVALAVLAAAVGLYVAVRSDLRGEIDGALRERAQAFFAPVAHGARRARRRPDAQAADRPDPAVVGGPRGGSGAAGHGGGPASFPGSVQPAPFGAASGYVQFISPDGAVEVPGGQGSSPAKIAVTATRPRDRGERAAAAALTDRSVQGDGAARAHGRAPARAARCSSRVP